MLPVLAAQMSFLTFLGQKQ